MLNSNSTSDDAAAAAEQQQQQQRILRETTTSVSSSNRRLGHMHACGQCLFQVSFVGGGELPPPTYNSPQTAAKLCALNLFFGRDNELQIYNGNLLMDNKHRTLLVIKQSKRCKFMSKMHQNKFGGRLLRTRWGELMRSPSPPSRNGAYF